MKFTFFILIIILSCTSCKEKLKTTKTFLQGNDIKVSLDISNADTSLTSIFFRTDLNDKMIFVPKDSMHNIDNLVFGYQCGGESAFSISAIFDKDTVRSEFYAEIGYRPELAIIQRKLMRISN